MIDNLLSLPLRRLLNRRTANAGQFMLPLTSPVSRWRLTLKVSEVADRYLINLISLGAASILALIFAIVLDGLVQQIALLILLIMLAWTALVTFARARLLKLSDEVSTLTVESEQTLTIGSAYRMCIKSSKGVFVMSKAPQLIWKMKTVGGPDIRVLRGSCQIKNEDTQSPQSIYYCEGILPKDALPTDEPLINVYAELQLWIQGFRFAFIVPIKRPKLEVGE